MKKLITIITMLILIIIISCSLSKDDSTNLSVEVPKDEVIIKSDNVNDLYYDEENDTIYINWN